MSATFESVLQNINRKCIAFPVEIEKRNNRILKELVETFIEKMKSEDPNFKLLFNRIFYGGSYYDNLKVGAPDEYDLDLLLKLPKQIRYQLYETGDYPGFVGVKIENPELLGDKLMKHLVQDNKLSSDKLRRWMEGLITTVLRKFPCSNGYYQISAGGYQLKGKMRKSGPAMTLLVTDVSNGIELDIDLVPCFEFEFDKLPPGKWRKNPIPSKKTFFIVPKHPKSLGNVPDVFWRLSFQEQERELIKDRKSLKPALRLIKKLRSVCGFESSLASYYIKTIFLWENEKHGEKYFSGTLNEVFAKLLASFILYLERGKIPYFWNEKLNLLGTLGQQPLSNMANRFKRIGSAMERHRETNPEAVFELFKLTAN